MRRSLLLAGVLPIAALAAACGGSSSSSTTAQTSTAPAAKVQRAASDRPHYASPVSISPQPAPPISLHDQFGKRVSLASLQGKAVMLTFVYTHCPDVCPVILQTLGAARHSLGKQASRFAIVAVSVDPRGDRPAYVRRFLAQRRMLHSVDYLLGTRAQLAPVWRRYNVESAPGTGSEKDLVAHSAFIFGIDTHGTIRTLYPASPLDPKAIVHDVPLLLRT
jgi:protein SCO1/2